MSSQPSEEREVSRRVCWNHAQWAAAVPDGVSTEPPTGYPCVVTVVRVQEHTPVVVCVSHADIWE